MASAGGGAADVAGACAAGTCAAGNGAVGACAAAVEHTSPKASSAVNNGPRFIGRIFPSPLANVRPSTPRAD
jgi:hypothetical protein